MPSMPESHKSKRPLNSEWTIREELIAEEKKLCEWVEEGHSWSEITRLDQTRFKRSSNTASLKRQYEKLKNFKDEYAKVCFYALHFSVLHGI